MLRESPAEIRYRVRPASRCLTGSATTTIADAVLMTSRLWQQPHQTSPLSSDHGAATSGPGSPVASPPRPRRKRARANGRVASTGLRCASASRRAREDGTGLVTGPPVAPVERIEAIHCAEAVIDRPQRIPFHQRRLAAARIHHPSSRAGEPCPPSLGVARGFHPSHCSGTTSPCACPPGEASK